MPARPPRRPRTFPSASRAVDQLPWSSSLTGARARLPAAWVPSGWFTEGLVADMKYYYVRPQPTSLSSLARLLCQRENARLWTEAPDPLRRATSRRSRPSRSELFCSFRVSPAVSHKATATNRLKRPTARRSLFLISGIARSRRVSFNYRVPTWVLSCSYLCISVGGASWP